MACAALAGWDAGVPADGVVPTGVSASHIGLGTASHGARRCLARPDPAARREHRRDSRGLPDPCPWPQPVQLPSLHQYLPVHIRGPRGPAYPVTRGVAERREMGESAEDGGPLERRSAPDLTARPTAALIAQLARQANRGAQGVSPGARGQVRLDSIDLFLRSRR